ncbi:MAG: ABC transporter permease [Bacteroidetes bacterium]|nr:ABC transporter permease [Bacteroidota bacterium]
MSFTTLVARRFLQFRRSTRAQSFLSFVTIISIVGVALGVASLIIALTILGGFEKELKEKVVGFTTHIQVSTYTNQPIRYYDNVERKLREEIPELRSVSAYIAKEGMVNFGDATEGVIVKGIESTDSAAGIGRYLTEGALDLRQFDTGLYGCAVGRKLLTTLGASLHDTLLVFGLQGHIQTSIAPSVLAFVVNGVYESGMSEYDDIYFFVSIPAAQHLVNFEGAVSGFEVMVQDVDSVQTAADRIVEVLGYPFTARTLFQLYRNLFTWIELQKEPIPIILGLIIAVAAVNVIGTLLMLVLEKRKQVGILRSLGASARSIRRIFVMNGVIIAVAGTLLGNAVGFLVCWVQQQYHIITLPSTIYFMKTVPIHFRAEHFLIVSAVSITLCILAAYIPARLASRMDPIKAIRLG